ncbi:DUF5691 domain-containing protein [Shewanella corallii]|uniref:DUF5691 domain-containing protein n=1 Tax=Shewanella corallii TaxID=560080 RepID=A0ABT0NC81_9GAMM|nr:DUF5691 domain-containing protein [Shewanella corallii]MCL2916053.1 DUF5691 domain-containing protein [Shewanella corallii]
MDNLFDTQLPVLTAESRPAFKRLLKQLKKNEFLLNRFLVLIESRGWTPHPEDWSPNAQFTLIPDSLVFELVGNNNNVQLTEQNGLEHDQWQALMPSIRLRLLQYIRKRNPAYARALIEQFVLGEKPDNRAALYKVLHQGLNHDDLPLLHHAMKDKSAKVRAVIALMLLRLGEYPDADYSQDLMEVSQWLVKKHKGLFKRRLQIYAPMLNSAHIRNLSNILASVPLCMLAQKMSLSMEQFLGAWSFMDNRIQGTSNPNRVLVNNAVTALNNKNLALLLDNLVTSMIEDNLDLRIELETLATRLSLQQQQALISQLLRSAPAGLMVDQLWNVSPLPWDWLSATDLKASPTYTRFISQMSEVLGDNREKIINQMHLPRLELLGLILNQECAKLTMDNLIQAGLSETDTALDTLKFNIELAHS